MTSQDEGGRGDLVPIHLARNINVIHEALNVQRQVRGVGAHQLLQFLTLLVQSQESPGVLPHIELVPALEVLTEIIYQCLVKITTTQIGVKSCSEDLRGRKKIHSRFEFC